MITWYPRIIHDDEMAETSYCQFGHSAEGGWYLNITEHWEEEIVSLVYTFARSTTWREIHRERIPYELEPEDPDWPDLARDTDEAATEQAIAAAIAEFSQDYHRHLLLSEL